MSLNERIARGKGLKVLMLLDGSAPIINDDGSVLVDTGKMTPEAFDFTKDPERILELVLELGEAGWSYRYDWQFKVHLWRKYSNFMSSVVDIKHEDFGQATAMAYCEEKGL